MIQEEIGDLWGKYSAGFPIAITTNGFVKRNGLAVMGRGIAFEATQRMPGLQLELGERLRLHGNHVFFFNRYNVFTFPVKQNWWESALPSLIVQSIRELNQLCTANGIERVYLPRPGCGNGRLSWETVKAFIEPFDTSRFIFMSRE